MEPNGFHIPSRAEALAKRKAERDGFAFPLTITGGVARVRRITLVELAANDALPAAMQAVVLEAFNEANQRDPNAPMTWDVAKHNIQRQTQLARIMCISGFITPRLVESQSEADAADDPNVWWVDDLYRDEQVAYLNLCLSISQEDAAGLAPFPAPGVESLATVSAGPALWEQTVRPLGAEPPVGGQSL
jgi:hypothetical protein